MTKARRRVTIVTGATGAIGSTVVQLLLERGGCVMATGRRPDAPRRHARLRYEAGDVTDEAFVEGLVRHAIGEFGHLDSLVNAHGIDYHSDISSTPIEDARRVIEVNLVSAFITTKHVARHITRPEGGAIVNVASRLGSVAIPGQAVYSMSKGGLIMLTRAAAIDLAADGIRVNAVAPGVTATPMIDEWIATQADPRAFERQLVDAIPLRRMATTRDVAEAVVFLLSDAAASITAAILPVDGGYTAA